VTIWLDNHLSPALARWTAERFGEACIQVRDLGLGRAPDRDVFSAAQGAARVLVTKDADVAELVARLGPPPAIILLTCGNTSTAHLRTILASRLSTALDLIATGEPLVEIGA